LTITNRPLDLEAPSIVFVYAAWSAPSVAGWGETFWVRDGRVVASVRSAGELRDGVIEKNNALLR
jgi:hypothetical protein